MVIRSASISHFPRRGRLRREAGGVSWISDLHTSSITPGCYERPTHGLVRDWSHQEFPRVKLKVEQGPVYKHAEQMLQGLNTSGLGSKA